jgi:hypothetical protein
MKGNALDDIAPRLVWVSRPERRLAVRASNRWAARIDKNVLLRALPRQRVALSFAYSLVAMAWLPLVSFLLLGAALSLNHGVQAGFALAAVPPSAVASFRLRQAWRACPELYRLPPRNRNRG